LSGSLFLTLILIPSLSVFGLIRVTSQCVTQRHFWQKKTSLKLVFFDDPNQHYVLLKPFEMIQTIMTLRITTLSVTFVWQKVTETSSTQCHFLVPKQQYILLKSFSKGCKGWWYSAQQHPLTVENVCETSSTKCNIFVLKPHYIARAFLNDAKDNDAQHNNIQRQFWPKRRR